MYILIKKSLYVECSDLLEVSSNFHIEITINGEVICDGVKDTISYNLNELSKEDIIKSFIYNRLTKVMDRVKLYKVGEIL
jgi:hypothetical protein